MSEPTRISTEGLRLYLWWIEPDRPHKTTLRYTNVLEQSLNIEIDRSIRDKSIEVAARLAPLKLSIDNQSVTAEMLKEAIEENV